MAKRAKKKNRAPRPVAAAPSLPVRKTPPAGTTHATADDAKIILRTVLILALGLWIYWPALHGDWLWDDRDLIVENALVHDPDGLRKIWFEPNCLFDFLPLKVSVEWIEWRVWGADTLGYHAVNLGLHLLSAILLWRLLHKFGLRHAWLGGLIFTVHPVIVESVAWIAELKNTLSLPVFLLAMGAWLDYDARRKVKDYGLALGLFVLALLAKPTMIMFPVVILLHAWWKRGRVAGRDLQAAAPFFAVSLAMGLATLWFLHRTAGEQTVVLGGVMSRLACAGLSISFYFSKCVLPLDLMTIYPQWIVDPPTPLQFLPWPVLGGVLYFLWSKRAGWGRHALLGLGFFLINLAPFLGLNAGSYMNYTWVMDHVLYIPIIGLIGLTVAALAQAEAQLAVPFRWAGAALVALVVAFMAWSSHGYAGLYVDLETLWRYNTVRNPTAALPHNDLGYALAQQGRLAEAIEQTRLAAQLKPNFKDARHNLGLLLLQTGQFAEAVTELQATEQLTPYLPDSHYNLGVALDHIGRIPEAEEEYRQAMNLDPGDTQACNNLAADLVEQRRLTEALQVLQSALQVSPNDAETQGNLARVVGMQSHPAPK